MSFSPHANLIPRVCGNLVSIEIRYRITLFIITEEGE